MPPRETSLALPENHLRPTRREWGLVLLVVLAGLIIRGAAAGRMAVEHFDEGVYASNLWFGVKQGMRYPARHLYAPPFVPWLAEWSQIILGPTHWGTMLPGVVSGTLTILACWWCVRRWFGSRAGLVAATLAGFSDYHLIYSRTVLTEPVLCLWLLVSVFLIWRAVVERDWRWALLAGLSTGLTWITKYNGWLPLGIGLAGLSAWSIFPPRADAPGRRFLILAGIAAVALVVVFPVWQDLQPDGGYRVVQENHARYIVGLSGWLSSWQRQLANHQFFDGPLSWGGLLLAVVLAGLIPSSRHEEAKTAENKRLRPLAWTTGCALVMLAFAMWFGTSVVLGILGAGWLIAACPIWNKSEAEDPSRDLAYWLLAAWFVGLFVATPLYTPYPRLSLPWLVTAWLTAAAMLVSPPFQKLLAGKWGWQSKPLGDVAWVLLAVLGLSGSGMRIAAGGDSPSPWQERTGLERIAGRIDNVISQKFAGRAVVYVYAEPALFYHLEAKGVSAVPVANLPVSERQASIPLLLVVGPHAERSPAFQREWQSGRHQFELLGRFAYVPSELVLFNQYSPEEIEDPAFQREQSIQLYLANPP